MGLFDKVLGGIKGIGSVPANEGTPSSDDDPSGPVLVCPDCEHELSPDPLIPGAYECVNPDCVPEPDIPTAAHVPGECPWCQSSLPEGETYAPYEDGSNEYAYVICPGCSQKILA